MGDVPQFETPTDANKHVHLIQRTGFYRTLHSSCRHKYVLLLSQYHLAYNDISLVYRARRLEDGSRTLPSARPRNYVRWRSSISIRLHHGNFWLSDEPWDTKQHGHDDCIPYAFADWIWLVYISLYSYHPNGCRARTTGHFGRVVRLRSFRWRQHAQAVSLAIFTTQVAKWTVDLVPTAAEMAGLPADQVAGLLGLVGTAQFSTTYSPAIVSAVGAAVQEAYRKGIQ
jgi:hypothetical protein